MGQTFSPSRAWYTLKYSIRTDAQDYVKNTVFIALLYAFIDMTFGNITFEMILMITVIGICLSGTNIIPNNKEGKLADLLSLPASMTEKYVARNVSTAVCVIVESLVAAAAALIATGLIKAIFFDGNFSLHMDNAKGDIISDVSLSALPLLLLLHSFFTLGGTLIRPNKLRILLTSVAAFAIMVVFACFMYLRFNDVDWDRYQINEEKTMMLTMCVTFLLIVLNYAASYFLFKRTQLVNNNILNP